MMQKGVILENNFLSKVIFRIDFTTILKIAGDKKEAAEDFQKKVFDNFPNVEIVHQNNININIGIESKTPENVINKTNICWIFRNEDGNKEISLTAENLTFSCNNKSYIGFKYFLNDILLIINALKEYLPFELNFLGLRYINQINDSEINDNIDKFINNSLSNSNVINDLNDDEKLSQIFNKLSFQKDKYFLNLQYGFFNTQFPDPNGLKNFILDYDCINNQIKSIDDVEENLKEMNRIIFEKFEYSIKDSFIEKMGEKNDSSN